MLTIDDKQKSESKGKPFKRAEKRTGTISRKLRVGNMACNHLAKKTIAQNTWKEQSHLKPNITMAKSVINEIKYSSPTFL